MNQFKDLNITPTDKGFSGEKIKMDKIINKTITVLDYKIAPSKFEKGNGKCLHMQIMYSNEKRVVFSGSLNLMETIEMIPEDKFPFETIIVKTDSDRLQFT